MQESLDELRVTTNKTQKVVTDMQSDHHIAEIERWLSPPDYASNAKKARELRHAGTGTWFLESAGFQEWKNGSRQHLWLYSLAGGGKTVLLTTILDHILQIENRTILKFFFDFNDIRKQTVEGLLLSVAFQLYSHGVGMAELEKCFEAAKISAGISSRPEPITKNVLSNCVEAMIKLAKQKIWIVVDALDECTTRSDLLEWIRSFTDKNIHLLVTSRPEVEFKNNVPGIFGEHNCISFDNQAVNVNIRSYVAEALKRMPAFIKEPLDEELSDLIIKRVGDGADGM